MERVFFKPAKGLIQDAWIMQALAVPYYSAVRSPATCLHTHRGICWAICFESLPQSQQGEETAAFIHPLTCWGVCGGDKGRGRGSEWRLSAFAGQEAPWWDGEQRQDIGDSTGSDTNPLVKVPYGLCHRHAPKELPCLRDKEASERASCGLVLAKKATDQNDALGDPPGEAVFDSDPQIRLLLDPQRWNHHIFPWKVNTKLHHKGGFVCDPFPKSNSTGNWEITKIKHV